ncbi:putative Co/Zn/Cd efflux system membrane fusion protein [Fimbriiglobus ruber]|uniref:Putative Co/Zn/Cd efflux system membrane fusion protein n=1 Tax=Fimbriiglobus ruber TaxID=1908690 RepID=A0A225DJR1_9BACT|nr:putative Co/Zn/Cd efflux system membrane fusion protein [Fimbriiglobus ruber]
MTVLARLRFVGIIAVIGVVIVKWVLINAYYEKWARPAGETATTEPDAEYFCPMHPSIVRDNNKDKCPVCFMPLSKRRKGEMTDAPLPPGVVSRVQLSPYRVVLAGVQTSSVTFLPLAKEIATIGTVEFDERGLKHVAARVKGRIDKLAVNQTGQMVHRGDELATLYSPDLVVTAQNLIDANRSGNSELERIARDRLSLWGLEPDQIDRIAKSGKPATQITVRSPTDGHVIKRYQTEGRYVDEGTPLYDVADLNTVWIQAQVYEDDLAFLPAEVHDLTKDDRLPATVVTRAYPGQSFSGTLSFVYPHVDQESRTLSVRFELTNPDGRLKPGMTATVTFAVSPAKLAKREGSGSRLRLEGGKVLAVPESSVIDTGSMKVVYREASHNEYEGVRVELGPRMVGQDGVPYFPVLSGLEPGQTVVTAGSFLVDAETRLNPAAGSIYFGGSGAKSSTVRPSTPDDEDAKVSTFLSKLPPADRVLAEAQGTCPVLDGSRLGAMGVPVKLNLSGKTVFICCPACEEKATAATVRTLARTEELRAGGKPPPKKAASPAEEAEIAAALVKLAATDRPAAEVQRYCPDTGERLGAMGVPQKVVLDGKLVFVCCKACIEKVRAEPAVMLGRVEAFKKGQAPKR